MFDFLLFQKRGFYETLIIAVYKFYAIYIASKYFIRVVVAFELLKFKRTKDLLTRFKRFCFLIMKIFKNKLFQYLAKLIQLFETSTCTVNRKIFRALAITLMIYRWFDCQFYHPVLVMYSIKPKVYNWTNIYFLKLQ